MKSITLVSTVQAKEILANYYTKFFTDNPQNLTRLILEGGKDIPNLFNVTLDELLKLARDNNVKKNFDTDLTAVQVDNTLYLI